MILCKGLGIKITVDLPTSDSGFEWGFSLV